MSENEHRRLILFMSELMQMSDPCPQCGSGGEYVLQEDTPDYEVWRCEECGYLDRLPKGGKE